MPCDRKIGPFDCCSVVQGDCLELMKQLPDGCVDAVITDPPYFLPAVHYSTRKVWPRSLGELGILEGFYKQFFPESSRVLADHGVMYCFCDGQSYPVFYANGYTSFKSQRPLIWDKLTAINGYSWRHQHELILFAIKRESENVPTGDGDILRFRSVPIDDREHPAEKPVELMGTLISKSVRDNGLVVDPFCGSSATLVAAKKLGRHFLGFEISPEYCDIARKRIAAVEAQPTLFQTKPEQQTLEL
jgi:site-specific DNA-methyltransferase (adenine-specific)